MSGGIDFGALYGPAADAVPDEQLVKEGSAARRVEVELNTAPVAPIALDFVARSVLVDNASGAWYQVNGRWIPPWTIGAVILLDLPATNLEIAAAPPSGHFTVLAGDPLVVIALEAQLAPHPGLAVTPHRSLVAKAMAFDAGGITGAVEELLPMQTGSTRIMVDAISVGTYFAAGGQLAQYNYVRDEHPVILWASSATLGPTSESLAIGAISPERPAMRIAFEPGAIITNLERGIGVEVSGLEPSGGIRMAAVLEYRLVVITP